MKASREQEIKNLENVTSTLEKYKVTMDKFFNFYDSFTAKKIEHENFISEIESTFIDKTDNSGSISAQIESNKKLIQKQIGDIEVGKVTGNVADLSAKYDKLCKYSFTTTRIEKTSEYINNVENSKIYSVSKKSNKNLEEVYKDFRTYQRYIDILIKFANDLKNATASNNFFKKHYYTLKYRKQLKNELRNEQNSSLRDIAKVTTIRETLFEKLNLDLAPFIANIDEFSVNANNDLLLLNEIPFDEVDNLVYINDEVSVETKEAMIEREKQKSHISKINKLLVDNEIYFKGNTHEELNDLVYNDSYEVVAGKIELCKALPELVKEYNVRMGKDQRDEKELNNLYRLISFAYRVTDSKLDFNEFAGVYCGELFNKLSNKRIINPDEDKKAVLSNQYKECIFDLRTIGFQGVFGFGTDFLDEYELVIESEAEYNNTPRKSA